MILICIDILDLTGRLDGLPLAIVIAGAFMRETGINATEYLEYYQESWSNLQLQLSPLRQYQQGNMLQTWMISYHEIQKRDLDAAKLLLVLAHFDNRDLWYELIQGCCYSSDVPLWLKRITASSLAFKISVRTLLEFSLLEIKPHRGAYMMHSVVQNWCLHVASLEENIHPLQLSKMALIAVGYATHEVSDSNYYVLQQRLIPHARHVCRGDWLICDVEIWGALHSLGDLYFELGSLKEAEEMYQRALSGREKTFGPEYPATLSIVNNIGNLFRAQGKLELAEQMYQRALLGRERALGLEHAFTLATVTNLGNLYKDQGKLEQAEELYQRALTGREKVLGLEHMFTLNTVGNLGLLYQDQGKPKNAEEMYQRALAGFEKTLGSDHERSRWVRGKLNELNMRM